MSISCEWLARRCEVRSAFIVHRKRPHVASAEHSQSSVGSFGHQWYGFRPVFVLKSCGEGGSRKRCPRYWMVARTFRSLLVVRTAPHPMRPPMPLVAAHFGAERCLLAELAESLAEWQISCVLVRHGTDDSSPSIAAMRGGRQWVRGGREANAV